MEEAGLAKIRNSAGVLDADAVTLAAWLMIGTIDVWTVDPDVVQYYYELAYCSILDGKLPTILI